MLGRRAVPEQLRMQPCRGRCVRPGTDLSPPDVAAASVDLRLAVPSGCPLPAVSALGPRGYAALAFVVTKRLAEPPRVTAASADHEFVLTLVESEETRYTFGVLLPDAVRPGTYELRVGLVDQQRIPALVALAPRLVVDGEPPRLPSPAALAGRTLRSLPRGGVETAGAAAAWVSAPEGSFESGNHVVVTAEGSLDPRHVLGAAAVGEDGDVQVELSAPTTAPLHVTVLDQACNAAAEGFAPVRRLRLTVTPEGTGGVELDARVIDHPGAGAAGEAPLPPP